MEVKEQAVPNLGSSVMLKKIPCGVGYEGSVIPATMHGYERMNKGSSSNVKILASCSLPRKLKLATEKELKKGSTVLMPVGMMEGRGEIIMKMTKHSAGAVSRSDSSGYYRVKKAASYLKSKEKRQGFRQAVCGST